jgi:flavin reductase (DIM6/NTAB) family NADH-FMN oxidoreductase RutF
MELEDSVAAALGRIPSGCFVLSVSHGEQSTGVLVSWVQQASFDPPAITVCLKHGRTAIQWVDASGKFLLNVIGRDTAAAMFRHFGRGFTLGEDAFAGLETEPSEFGPLVRSGIAHLGCRVLNKISAGDHYLYVAEVVWGRADDGREPYTHLRKSGLNY